jgi:hypothetical protein
MNSDLAPMIDPRYGVIKDLLAAGAIKKFTETFEWIPHSVIAKDFKTSNARMKKMISDPNLWKIGELYKLADLIGWDKKKLILMAMQEGKEKENPGAQ